MLKYGYYPHYIYLILLITILTRKCIVNSTTVLYNLSGTQRMYTIINIYTQEYYNHSVY